MLFLFFLLFFRFFFFVRFFLSCDFFLWFSLVFFFWSGEKTKMTHLRTGKTFKFSIVNFQISDLVSLVKIENCKFESFT